MPVVVVHYAEGQEELALVSETLYEPTVQLVDSSGNEFTALLSQCQPAKPEQAKSYWAQRARHACESSIEVIGRLLRDSTN